MSTPKSPFWPLVLAAATILMINMGARQSLGLFVSPLDQASGLGIASISLAFAVSQLVWGIAQPIYGVLAERWGTRGVLILGALLTTIGTGLAPFAHSALALTVCLGVIAAAGGAAGSFAILIGGIARHLPEDRRAFASGFINAGSSFGQFLFAPLAQFLIVGFGWVNAMLALAASALLTIPFAIWMTARTAVTAAASAAADDGPGLRSQVRQALGDRSYQLLHLAFFTCGFHIAFLVTICRAKSHSVDWRRQCRQHRWR